MVPSEPIRVEQLSEPAGLQIDMLKPHVQAIFDEIRRVGPQGCRAARYEVEARFRAEPQPTHDLGSPDCSGLHVLAAVAMQIYMDVSGQDGAVPAYIEALIAQKQANDCEAAAAAP
jgi:hypothetical protein